MLIKRIATILVALAGLASIGYLGNQDRVDSMRIHAAEVCARAEHDHHIVEAYFDMQKCVDWNAIHEEDDDR